MILNAPVWYVCVEARDRCVFHKIILICLQSHRQKFPGNPSGLLLLLLLYNVHGRRRRELRVKAAIGGFHRFS